MTLNKTILLGFSIVIVVLSILGGTAAYKLFILKHDAHEVASLNIPEIKEGALIERGMHHALFTTLKYKHSASPTDYNQAVDYLDEVIAQINLSEELAQEHNAVEFVEFVENARVDVQTYRKHIKQMKAVEDKIYSDFETFEHAGHSVIENAHAYIKHQEDVFKESIDRDTDKAQKHYYNISKAQEIIEIAEELIIASYKAKAMDDSGILADSNNKFQTAIQTTQYLINNTSSASDKELLKSIIHAVGLYEHASQDFIKNWQYLSQLQSEIVKTGEHLIELVIHTADSQMTKAEQTAEQNAQEANFISWLLIIGISVTIALAAFFGVFMPLGIYKNLRQLKDGLRGAVQAISATSSNVNDQSKQLADSSTQQASSVEETSASLEEIASMTKANADNAQETNTLMKETVSVVEEANQSMTDLTHSMDEICTSSEETQKIIKTIDEIAFQTNILALNAAVEAARAGEAGAGFAVVADEVRNLAQRAAKAAQDTARLIEESVANIQKGTETVNNTSKAFNRVQASATQAVGLVEQITQSSNEQAEGISQINQAVANIDMSVQSNVSSAHTVSDASNNLSQQSHTVEDLIKQLDIMLEGKSTAHTSKLQPTPNTTTSLQSSSAEPVTPAPSDNHQGESGFFAMNADEELSLPGTRDKEFEFSSSENKRF